MPNIPTNSSILKPQHQNSKVRQLEEGKHDNLHKMKIKEELLATHHTLKYQAI